MRNVVTNIDGSNKPTMFNESLNINSFFGKFVVYISPFVNNDKKSKLLIFDKLVTIDKKLFVVNFNPKCEILSLYFDGSKSKEGVGVGCLLLDCRDNKIFVVCRLELECTNNVAKYQGLIEGLKKDLDLKMQCLKVYGEYEIIIT